MKRFGDTSAGKMNPQDLYPPRKWIKASDILEQPFTLVRANTGKANTGNDCAYLTVTFQRLPARVTDHNGEPVNRYDEYTISHQGAKIVGVISHMVKDDFPCGPVCFVAVSTPGSMSKSHELWDYDQLEQERAREMAEDSPFGEEVPFESEPEQTLEQIQPKSTATRIQATQQRTRTPGQH